MRRAFKVATAFTGAAACATAFTPALPAGAVTLIPADVINCGRTANTSVHLYWSVNEHHGPTCIGGYQDKSNFGTVHFVSLCAGNNFGDFRSANYAGTWLYGASLNGVYNSGYNHEDFGLYNGTAQRYQTMVGTTLAISAITSVA